MARRVTTAAQSAIRAFAEKHRLKVTIDRGDGTPIIRGRKGQIFEHDDRLAIMCISEGEAVWSTKGWNSARRAGELAGMTVEQDGDTEGTLLFARDNREQARLAIKLAACKPRRVLSPQMRQKAVEQLQAYRAREHEGSGAFTASLKPTAQSLISA